MAFTIFRWGFGEVASCCSRLCGIYHFETMCIFWYFYIICNVYLFSKIMNDYLMMDVWCVIRVEVCDVCFFWCLVMSLLSWRYFYLFVLEIELACSVVVPSKDIIDSFRHANVHR